MKTNHSPVFKKKVVIEAIRGERTINEIASANQIHPNLVTRWKSEALERFEELFVREKGGYEEMKKKLAVIEEERDELYKQIGKLTTANEWLKKKYNGSVQ